jgi:hypothetical protein
MFQTLKYACTDSPYLSDGGKTKTNCCPFYLVYKYSIDEDEFYMESYDEMHNHLLVPDPRIIPFVKKSVKKPIFQTPMFFRFQTYKADNFDHFQHQVKQTANERCFDVNFAGEFGGKVDTSIHINLMKKFQRVDPDPKALV